MDNNRSEWTIFEKTWFEMQQNVVLVQMSIWLELEM